MDVAQTTDTVSIQMRTLSDEIQGGRAPHAADFRQRLLRVLIADVSSPLRDEVAYESIGPLVVATSLALELWLHRYITTRGKFVPF